MEACSAYRLPAADSIIQGGAKTIRDPPTLPVRLQTKYRISNVGPQNLEPDFEIHHSLFDIPRLICRPASMDQRFRVFAEKVINTRQAGRDHRAMAYARHLVVFVSHVQFF